MYRSVIIVKLIKLGRFSWTGDSATWEDNRFDLKIISIGV
jgi:hypothetical protein